MTPPHNEEEARTDGRKDHIYASAISYFDSKGSEETNVDGSESGSGFYSNRFIQALDEAATGSKREIKEKEPELSGEDEEKIGERKWTRGYERERQLNSTAGRNMLQEKVRESKVETAVENALYTETGSGNEIRSEAVSGWSEDVSGSGEGGGDGGEDGKRSNAPLLFDSTGMGKGKEASEGNDVKVGDRGDGSSDNNKKVESGRRHGPDSPATEDLPFGSSEDNGNGGGAGDDEEDHNTSLDSGVVFGDSTFVSNRERKQSGGVESDVSVENRETGVAGESFQELSSVDGLLFKAGRSPMLGRLVPLLRLTDANKAGEEQTEGKW